MVTKVREIRVSYFAQGTYWGQESTLAGFGAQKVWSATPGVALRAGCKGGGQRQQLLRNPERAGANDPDGILQPAVQADTMHLSSLLN